MPFKDADFDDSKRTLKSQRDNNGSFKVSSRRERVSGPASPTGLHTRLAPRHLGDPDEDEMVRVDSVLDNLA